MKSYLYLPIFLLFLCNSNFIFAGVNPNGAKIRIISVKGAPAFERKVLHSGDTLVESNLDSFCSHISYQDKINGYVRYRIGRESIIRWVFPDCNSKKNQPLNDATATTGVFAVRSDILSEPCFQSFVSSRRKTFNYNQLNNYFTGAIAYVNWGLDTICIRDLDLSDSSFFSILYTTGNVLNEKKIESENGCILIPANFNNSSAEVSNISIQFTLGTKTGPVAENIHFVDIPNEVTMLKNLEFSEQTILLEIQKLLFGQELSESEVDKQVKLSIEKNIAQLK